jgi:hypothetical protein
MHESHELDNLLYLRGGGSGGQLATGGISTETTLQALSNTSTDGKMEKKPFMFLLWLKCMNLIGVTCEQPKWCQQDQEVGHW